MIAAIYARKSTDQSGISDDQKSVARQVEHARAYATRKGWTISEAHIFIDDGISGAEFDKRPGLQRLRTALKPRPAFSVLIVSEQSRLSRDTADTLQVLKELSRAGVRVYGYQDDRAISLETPGDTLFTTINAWKDSEARRESSVRTYDAMQRKAKAGHVTGGRVFGYKNVDVYAGVDAHGRPQRSHVMREIRDEEAAVVRRVFELCASGYGVKRIAAQLNVERCPRPRAQQGRIDGWASSSVHAVLFRELYRGVEIWNRTKKRNAFGQHQVTDNAPSEWMRIDVPALRIVSDSLWDAAHARLTKARQTYLAGTQGGPWGRPTTGTAAKYLLTGLSRCAVCGGGLAVATRAHGRAPRSQWYTCSAYKYRGASVCANGLPVRLGQADEAVIELMREDLLRPSVVEPAIALAVEALLEDKPAALARQRDLELQLVAINQKLALLTSAIEAGGHLPALLTALTEREAERVALRAELRTLATVVPARPTDRRGLEKAMKVRVAEWRDALRRNVTEARGVLGVLLADRLLFTPTRTEADERGYNVTATLALGRICSGILVSQGGTSPTGFEPVF